MGERWTERQFIGGTVALDFANTVCYRGEDRQFDKIAGAEDIADFAAAALAFSDASRWAGHDDTSAADSTLLALAREIREAVDGLFRPLARRAAPDGEPYRFLLRVHQDLIARLPLACGPDGIAIAPAQSGSFAAALTQSALRLAHSADLARTKICPNCRWLFIDRSKNASRTWCDMLVCGNRAKAARFQQRRGAGVSTVKEPVGG
jgi:predicted RNA-binding Zn ribbon-like protein